MWGRLNKIHKSIDWIYVSIDAATEKTYKTIRRGGNFERLLKNLEFISSLRKNKKIQKFELTFVVQQDNYREMKEFVELCKRFDCDLVVFLRLHSAGEYVGEKYGGAAIHEKAHPEYDNFINILKDPIFREPIVYMSNLSEFVGK